MGCCSSQPSAQAPTGRGAFPAPLPPPMQDNMNELLNRWRHAEVNLLQRRFRLARAQSVKHTIASKIRSSLAGPSSNTNTGTATSAATSVNRDTDSGSAIFGEEKDKDNGSTASPASRDGATAEVDSRRSGESSSVSTTALPVPAGPAKATPNGTSPHSGGAAAGQGQVLSLGDAGGARAGMDKEAFLRVFPDLQELPVEVQRSSFRLFDCVGRGSLDFRNFCRALALCCRGSREERLRFLFDLFSGASQPKHFGTQRGPDGGPRDATSSSGAPAVASLSETEFSGLKKQLGLSAGDADHTRFKAAPGVPGLLLSEYFEWAEVHASDEALDRALRPFYLLPSPQQEKDKVLAHLMEYKIEEGQSMCLVAAPWWAYWSSYVALTKADVLRVPERVALGLHKTEECLGQAPAEEPIHGKEVKAEGEGVVGTSVSLNVAASSNNAGVVGAEAGGAGGGNGNGHAAPAGGQTTDSSGGAGKERVVPTMLARRPHEIDNSSLQGGAEWEVAPNLFLGDDYIMLPKSLWDIMVEWYGGGPVFSRKVVKVSLSPSRLLQLPERAQESAPGLVPGMKETEAGPSSSSLTVDLYPLALHVSVSDAAGRPSGRERLVLTSHHVHIREMLQEALSNSSTYGNTRGLSMTPEALNAQAENRAVSAAANAEQEHDMQQLSEQGASGSDASLGKQHMPPRHEGSSNPTEDVRLWVLETSTSGLLDTPRMHTAASTPGARRPRFSYGGGQALGSVDPQSGLHRWKLVQREEEEMTLAELGLIGGEKVMLEHKNQHGKWPRFRYIEDPGFRHFHEGDRVDAMDYQGRWFRGQVVEVGSKSSSKNVDSDGPIGRKKSNRRHRLELDPPLREPIREVATQRGHESEGGIDYPDPAVGSSEVLGAEVRSAGKPGAPRSSSSDSQRQRRASGREASRSGDTSSSESGRSLMGGDREGGSGSSRRRTRVRIHFDRFAPQWDEWYDSKSLKLAPEGSYTAPVVPTQPLLRPRDEANGETEDASPNSTVAADGPGAHSSGPSKAGGGAYLPPVGRFPGDASSSWNARSQNSARTNGTNGGADGISNYGGGALNRRSNTPGKPPLPGACGLVNVGNTCYLNSAVQCLSHTPLVRAYLLSDMWAAEVNKCNPLGTQGKLVEDFASLLKSLWSQEYLCVFPSKFKRGLIKCKPQFAGNEQQDSQEFLAEMLDALHEDVNRVIDKPYVAAPNEDEAESGRSDQELADEAWDRHVQRNRSVIVDLFQGQLKMVCRCTVCDKKSVTFDPFMYLSVPIPVRNEKMVAVVMIPRIRTSYLVGAENDNVGEAAEFTNPRELVPVQYGIMLPRLGELSDLKRALSDLCGIPAPSLVVAILQQNQTKVLQDKDLLTELRDDVLVIALEMGESGPRSSRRRSHAKANGKPSASTPVAASTQATPSPASTRTLPGPATAASASASSNKVVNGTPEPPTRAEVAQAEDEHGSRVTLEESGADSAKAKGKAQHVLSKEVNRGNSNGNGVTPTEGSATATVNTATKVEIAAEIRSNDSEDGVDGEEDGDDDDGEGTDLEDDRLPTSSRDRRTPDERCTTSFPATLRDLELGWRLDALDGQGGWFAATVVEIDPQAVSLRRDGEKSSKAGAARSGDDNLKRKTEYLVKVHFDGFTSKWDESYGEQEWREKKLQPLFTKTSPQGRTLDIPVVHRKTIRVSTSGAQGLTLTHSVSTREGAGRGSGSEGVDVRDPRARYITAKDLFGLPFLVRCPPARSTRYLWRLVVQQASRFVAGASGGRSSKAESKDRMAKATSDSSQRPDFSVTAAWVARAAVGLESGISDEELRQLLPFTVKFVLRQNPLSEVGSVELVPDRWRAASSLLCPKLILALEWKDASRDYLDVLAATFDHPSYLELENKSQSVHSGLTLEQCLEAYTREETLEGEDSWYCSNCQAHRRGVMKIDLWKMPDVLVIHMKRFHCSARWREKIRTLVVFPHSGLDMSGFVSSNSAHKNQAGGGQAGMVYDLFGVVNHMGGMTGGHYTACCRSSPCSKDGVEEVTGWGLEHPWLNFDDEFVEEMAPDKIVSEAAYVLFYRRRRLTPSNVINMTI